MVNSMAWRVYGTTKRARYVVGPGAHGMVYGIAWRTSYGIWYGMAGIAWSMVWPGMVYGMVYAMS